MTPDARNRLLNAAKTHASLFAPAVLGNFLRGGAPNIAAALPASAEDASSPSALARSPLAQWFSTREMPHRAEVKTLGLAMQYFQKRYPNTTPSQLSTLAGVFVEAALGCDLQLPLADAKAVACARLGLAAGLKGIRAFNDPEVALSTVCNVMAQAVVRRV